MSIEFSIITNDDIRNVPPAVSTGILRLVKGLNDYEQPLTRFDFEQVDSEKRVYNLDHYLAPGNIITIAINKDTSEVLGMVINRINQTDNIKVSAIWYLYLHPQYRGVGLGRQLMETVEEMSRRLGATTALLSVLPDNASAIEFYEALGYKQQLINLAKAI